MKINQSTDNYRTLAVPGADKTKWEVTTAKGPLWSVEGRKRGWWKAAVSLKFKKSKGLKLSP